jgi:hypothetical protein
LALVQCLANQGLDDGLSADVEFFGGALQLLEHGRREIDVHALDGFHYAAGIGENRETSLPLSAIRAIVSADTRRFLRDVFFIEPPFRRGCFPQGHQVAELSFRIFPNLKNHRIQAVTYPTDGAMLSGKVRTLVSIVGMKENFLHFLEADSASRISPKTLALPLIEVKSHKV